MRFQELRDAGDPVECAAAYDAQGADELVFLDITASSDGRRIMHDVVAATAERCFMPLTVGGGLRSADDIEAMLRSGADKVSLNTSAIADPGPHPRVLGPLRLPVHRARDRRQVRARPRAALARVHPRRPQPDRPRRDRMGRQGRRDGRGRDPPNEHGPGRHAGRLRHRAHPPGERRGPRARGGERRRRAAWSTLPTCLDAGGASAVLAASLFHFGTLTIPGVKRYLSEQGVPVRL